MTRRTDRAPGDDRVRVSRAWLARYDHVVDDVQAFRAALEVAPPVDLFVPGGPADRDLLAKELRARGLGAEPLPFTEHHLRVAGHQGAGSLLEVVLGFAHPQGVSSATAPYALAPREGERVLDLCAAPGGKTALLDALAHGRAAIVANDRSRGRAGILVQTLSRMAVSRAIVVLQDGAAFPSPAEGDLFDAILVDAPCTGEGTFRAPLPRYDPRGEEGLVQANALQRRILERALDLLAPGGRLVYATCSYAPEENEAVVAHVLRTRDDLTLEPIPVALPGQPGLLRFGDLAFPPEMERARRVFPHHTGSWGFFLALLRKDPSSSKHARRRQQVASAPIADDPAARATAASYLRERFGVPETALGAAIVHARGRDLWLLSRPEGHGAPDLARLHVVAPGLRLIHLTSRGPRATTAGLRWLGPAIGANAIDLTREDAQRFVQAGRLPAAPSLPGGHVALRVDGRVVGAGLVSRGEIELEIPRSWR